MALHFFSWVCISSCALHSGHALRRDDGEYSPGSGEEVVGGDGSIGVAEQPEDQRLRGNGVYLCFDQQPLEAEKPGSSPNGSRAQDLA